MATSLLPPTFTPKIVPSFPNGEASLAAGKVSRIVIVEDEPLIALDVKRRLLSFGYEVAGIAGDGEAAVAMILELAPDLVLMDVRLQSEMDGIQAAEIVHRTLDVPVIFVTGNADNGTVERAQATHPFSYIVKPIHDRELKISIVAALHHHRLTRELRASRDQLEQRVIERTSELAKTNHLLQTQIGEHIKLECELRHARVMAEAAGRAKTNFFANISHEIRTPMNGIVGMADLLVGTPLNEEQGNFLKIMKTCANTLLATIDEIIEFSELEAGRIDLSSIQVDLRELLPAVLKPLEDRAHLKGIDLTCDIAPEVPAAIYGDPVRLGQVLLHLINFCVSSMNKGEIEVQCERLAETSSRSYVHFSIRETGDGLSPEMQKRVRRVFLQTNSALRELEDLGLGLAIPSMLVHLMDGVLWLDTIPGIGNMFHCALWLPTSPPTPLTSLPAPRPRAQETVASS